MKSVEATGGRASQNNFSLCLFLFLPHPHCRYQSQEHYLINILMLNFISGSSWGTQHVTTIIQECIKQHIPLLGGIIQKLQEKGFISSQTISGQLGNTYNSQTPFYIKHWQKQMTFIGKKKEATETRICREKSQEQGTSQNRSPKASAKIYFLKIGVHLEIKK